MPGLDASAASNPSQTSTYQTRPAHHMLTHRGVCLLVCPLWGDRYAVPMGKEAEWSADEIVENGQLMCLLRWVICFS